MIKKQIAASLERLPSSAPIAIPKTQKKEASVSTNFEDAFAMHKGSPPKDDPVLLTDRSPRSSISSSESADVWQTEEQANLEKLYRLYKQTQFSMEFNVGMGRLDPTTIY